MDNNEFVDTLALEEFLKRKKCAETLQHMYDRLAEICDDETFEELREAIIKMLTDIHTFAYRTAYKTVLDKHIKQLQEHYQSFTRGDS